MYKLYGPHVFGYLHCTPLQQLKQKRRQHFKINTTDASGIMKTQAGLHYSDIRLPSF
jgi:hypothetical protein